MKFNYYIKCILLNSIAASNLCPMSMRRLIYSLYGHHINKVYAECFVGYGKGHLSVGKNSYCNYRCFFDLGNDITIGRNCSIAFNVSFINSTHEIGSSSHRAGGGRNGKIEVKDGCWIGAGSTIMPGVIIESGCVIASNSLVLKSTQPNGLYAGIPAKRIKDLLE